MRISCKYSQQECIRGGCIPRSHYHTRVLPDRDPPPPGQRPPWTETTPWTETAPGQNPPRTETPLLGGNEYLEQFTKWILNALVRYRVSRLSLSSRLVTVTESLLVVLVTILELFIYLFIQISRGNSFQANDCF